MRKRIPIDATGNALNLINLSETISGIIPKIEEELIGSLEWYSQNAQYVPGSLKIISIEPIDDSRYKMKYAFHWRVFNPCLDIDAQETTTQTVNFECQSDAIVFDFIAMERVTAADEL